MNTNLFHTARVNGASGATLVEFALSFSVFMLLVVGCIDVGIILFRYSILTHAAESAARDLSALEGKKAASSTTQQCINNSTLTTDLGNWLAANPAYGPFKSFSAVIIPAANFNQHTATSMPYPVIQVLLQKDVGCILCRAFGGLALSAKSRLPLESKFNSCG